MGPLRRKLVGAGVALAVVLVATACDHSAQHDGVYGAARPGVVQAVADHDHGELPSTTTSATTTAATTTAPTSSSTAPSTTTSTPPAPAPLDVLGTDCTRSDLAPHDGFQNAPRCVATSFGEVAAADNSPSLLITAAPERVRAGKPFTIKVSTRNLVRDRFLGAAAGGYYREASFLDDAGLQRGHFHTACRMLTSTRVAPDAAPVPAFFVATQDGGGGADPDTVKVTIGGLPRGTAQCAVWAGDGSHRIPMMQRANQTPAFDVVRITVR